MSRCVFTKKEVQGVCVCVRLLLCFLPSVGQAHADVYGCTQMRLSLHARKNQSAPPALGVLLASENVTKSRR